MSCFHHQLTEHPWSAPSDRKGISTLVSLRLYSRTLVIWTHQEIVMSGGVFGEITLAGPLKYRFTSHRTELVFYKDRICELTLPRFFSQVTDVACVNMYPFLRKIEQVDEVMWDEFYRSFNQDVGWFPILGNQHE